MRCTGAILLLINVATITIGANPAVLHGRYTRDVELYDLLVPRKLTRDGKFLTFSIPHYFSGHGTPGNGRAKREEEEGKGSVHYGIYLDGRERHLELWPNRDLIAPDAVVERRDPNARVQDVKFEKLAGRRSCHYTGKVKGVDDSKVALSTCDGLAGYVKINKKRYFVEPLSEHVPNKRGQHLHIVYENPKKLESANAPNCGTRDWADAWKKRLRDQLLSGGEPKNQNKRAGMESLHRYIETLVVADKKFLEHHKNTDYELYIMTIMNMVSDFYHDASAGNQIDFVVVRMMFLDKEEEEIDLEISPDAGKTLDSFCNWQQTVNPKDIKNPNHHDIAILLTRYDICAKDTGCGLMGLAFVAAACTTDKPCGINEDSGLMLGIVVAHEVGHIMGCDHDEKTDSGCEAQAEDKSYHVMSPYVHLHTTIWSTCSKASMTAFFDEDLGECLNDEPESTLYQYSNMLPGSVYDAKYQCQTMFPGSTVCESYRGEFCERLACRTSPTQCMTSYEPPADGTKCGENKWCYKLKCVEIGERPEAVNGGWGEYGPYSQCSTTCGGGVAVSERDCNNPRPQHGGRYCLGERKKYKICNTHACPEGSPSFRAVQCSEHDKKPFQDKLYKWKPYYKEGHPCALFCLNNDNSYARLEPRVKDGTKCKKGTKNMCIGGICRNVGCDYVLDSDAKEDDCGVCKGDGTECKLVEKTYQGPPGRNYVKVAVIFRGCRNIEISELKPSDNTIAITGPDEKHYYLNGNFEENSDGVFAMGGVEGIYSHPEPNKELLLIHGPLKENIVLFVTYYVKENVGYRYKYAEPTSKSSYQPIYHWEFVDWEECSAKCDGGVEISQPKCIEEKHGLVSASFCQASDKPPPKTRKCNEEPCQTKWRVGKWGKCMACKNISGVRMREVECVKEASKSGEEDVLVEDDLCKEKKPGTKEMCNADSTCTPHKRQAFQLPEKIMKNVWLQTVVNEPNADLQIFEHNFESKNRFKTIRNLKSLTKRKRDNPGCPSEENSEKPKPKLNVGGLVLDKVKDDQLKLAVIPLKQSHNSINLTDEAFETMGDQIADTMDPSQEKVFKGAEAAKMLEQFAHSNCSIVETN